MSVINQNVLQIVRVFHRLFLSPFLVCLFPCRQALLTRSCSYHRLCSLIADVFGRWQKASERQKAIEIWMDALYGAESGRAIVISIVRTL